MARRYRLMGDQIPPFRFYLKTKEHVTTRVIRVKASFIPPHGNLRASHHPHGAVDRATASALACRKCSRQKSVCMCVVCSPAPIRLPPYKP